VAGASVGIVGLGKLGMPTAVALARHGHMVRGFDARAGRMTLSALPTYELDEDRARPLGATLGDDLDLHFCDLAEVVRDSDCVFVAVETPHGAEYEGVTPLPRTRSDFSYEPLGTALAAIVAQADRPIEIGIISTVLPGTMRSRLLPVATGHSLIYCPQFVAMGTVIFDLHHPEFTLLGHGDTRPAAVKEVLEGLRREPVPTFEISYESAELAKVAYNTFVGAKVTVANVIQQLADTVGASAAEVFGVLRSADRRLASASYLGPGMGDGGPCHPRDNIALSWLAGEVGMGHDLFSALMLQRQAYVEWLADKFAVAAAGRPMVLLGTAYKPGTPLETGSSSVLLANVMAARGEELSVVRSGAELPSDGWFPRPAAFFLGCPEPEFLSMRFPAGSTVIDPWHRIEPTEGIDVLRVGERP
jgi:UDPglucose 6-dehydrogenase